LVKIRVERSTPPQSWTWTYPGSADELVAEFNEGFAPAHLSTVPPGKPKNILGNVRKGSKGPVAGVLHLDGDQVWLELGDRRIDPPPGVFDPSAAKQYDGARFELTENGLEVEISAACTSYVSLIWKDFLARPGWDRLATLLVDHQRHTDTDWDLIAGHLAAQGSLPKLRKLHLHTADPETMHAIVSLAERPLHRFGGPQSTLAHFDTSEIQELWLTDRHGSLTGPLPPSLKRLTVSAESEKLIASLDLSATPELRTLVVQGLHNIRGAGVRPLVALHIPSTVELLVIGSLPFEAHARLITAHPSAKLDEPYPPPKPAAPVPPDRTFIAEAMAFLSRPLEDLPVLAADLIVEAASQEGVPCARPKSVEYRRVKVWASSLLPTLPEEARRTRAVAGIVADWLDPHADVGDHTGELAEAALALAGGCQAFDEEKAARVLQLLDRWW
jgi:hypothetical protein